MTTGRPGSVGRHFAAPVVRRPEFWPFERRKQAPRELALHVYLEKVALEVLEQPVAEQSVIRGGKTAPRHRRDRVHLVQQSDLLAFDLHPGLGQFLHDTVGERRGARAAPGKGQKDQQLVRAPAENGILELVAFPEGGNHGSFVDRVVRRAAARRDRCQQHEKTRTAARDGGRFC
jgi:hypothetical protein